MRAASRIGCENINIANALNMLLGGKAVVYYGEEIGMENYPRSEFSYEDCQDEWGKRYGPKRYLTFTRDMQRTPMQWDTNKNSGFTDGEKPWLPVNHNYMNKCVEKQLGHKRSHLEIFKELVKLRKEPSFLWGKLQLLVVNDQIFSFTRSAFGFATFLVVMNFSDSETRVNLLVNNSIAPRAYVKKYISGNIELNNSTNSEKVDLVERYKVQSPVLTKNVILNPHDCLILTWPSTD
jgi:alpha-glucosidase